MPLLISRVATPETFPYSVALFFIGFKIVALDQGLYLKPCPKFTRL